jgi:propionyl-CoA synthetase
LVHETANHTSKDENEYPLWYKDGELNICHLALDQHIEKGHGDQIAFIYDSPVTQTVKKI